VRYAALAKGVHLHIQSEKSVISTFGVLYLAMTKMLEHAVRQVEGLPEGEQNAAAGALLDYVKHMHDMRLTDEQIAEVRRRMADPHRKFTSLDDARERVAQFGK
jgi:hypothetical protein